MIKDNKMKVINDKNTLYELHIKNILDCTLSFLALIALSPVFLIISILIFIDDPGPVFFTQKRVGINKSYFKLHKFRSMKLNTPHDTPTHLLVNPEQYITGIGKFLRRYSLDELPQIWDIFVGNMSVIGPRPALWNQYDLIQERDRYNANSVRPGLTGWAQINGRDELEIDIKASLDGEYVDRLRRNSLSAFMMDVKCFMGTIISIVKADGVKEGGTGRIKKEKEIADMSQKKLLVITNHSYMFWQFRRELMCELQKDYHIVISTPFVGHEEDLKKLGFKMICTEVDRRTVNPWKDIKLFVCYFRMIRKEKPNKVITYSIKPNIYAGFACRLLKVPYYTNVQGLGSAFQKKGISALVSCMYRVSCKKARKVIFENSGNAEAFIQKNIIPEKKVAIMPGAGINLSYFRCVPYPRHEIIHFLYLGRIMKEKGIDELFSVMKRLHKEYGKKIVLDLVGFFEDEYKTIVNNMEEKGIVKFHGFQEDPRPYYASADCVVLPSYHEGMSNVLLEAAATGRCVITSDIPGCKEAVDNGMTGFLCKVRDRSSLYQAMKKIIEMSIQERESMGLRGRKKMEEDFSKDIVVRMTKEILCL